MRRRRRRLSGLQKRIMWEVDGEEEVEALRKRIGYPDRSNFRRSIEDLERKGRVETRLERGGDGRMRRVIRCDLRQQLRAAVNAPISEDEVLDYRLEPFALDDEDGEDWGDPEARRQLVEEVRAAAKKPLPGDEPEFESPRFTAELLEGLRRERAQIAGSGTRWPTPCAQ
jgi:hypothetical protein